MAIEDLVAQVIDRDRCVLRFDASLVDDLPSILRENYGIADVREAGQCRALAKLLDALAVGEDFRLEELPRALRAAGIDPRRFRPVATSELIESSERVFDKWSMETADENVGAVVNLQRDLGMGKYNQSVERHSTEWPGAELWQYLRGVSTAEPSIIERVLRRSYWELWISYWKWRGWLSPNIPSLSVGPRWVTEIRFFREILGLEQHVGLDLFSDDEGLVRAGDMHSMPYEDGKFQLVFIKNTIDKSYDVRRLVRELVRVVRPGGFLIVDQISGYGYCTPLTRTDIQRAENFVRLVCANPLRRAKVLVQKDMPLGNRTNDRARFNSRLAFQVF